MKKIVTIVVFLSVIMSQAFAQGGSNCSAAASSQITLPYTGTNQTSCGMSNVYTSSNTTTCGNGVFMDGEDVLYAFTPSTSGLININVTSSSSWVGLFIYEGCPSGGVCVDNSTSSSGNQTLSNVNVAAGITYYVMVDKWVSPTCISSFNINITAPVSAPAPTVQDCLGAIAVCQDVYSEANAYSGTGNILNEIDNGLSCLGSGEKNDVWYTFTTQTAGNVCFTIQPNVLSDDYDWGVYNLTNNSCSEINTNASLEVSCNYSGTSGNTGPNGNAGSQNESCISVQSGETYVVNVSQFSSSTNGYTIDFGASSATIFDNVPPELQAINSTISCGLTSLEFNFTENITCSTLADSNLTLTGPGGPYTVSSVSGFNCVNGATQDKYFTIAVTPAISEPGTYNFCTDNSDSTVTDLCGNFLVNSCLSFDIVYPIADAVASDTLKCTNPIVNLDGTGSSTGTYNWGAIGGNIVSGQTSTTPQVDQTGFYYIEVTNNDCISRDTVEVYQDASLPIVMAGTDTVLTCVTDTLQLTGSVTGNDLEYYWSGPNIVSGDSTLNPIVVDAGIYTLTAVDTVSGCQMSSSINVTESIDPPYVDAGLTNDITCTASSVNLDGSGSVAGSEYTYQWTDSLGNVVGDSIITTVTAPGAYLLEILNTSNNCSAQDVVVIGIDTLAPIANAGADTSLNCSTIATGVPIDGSNSQSGSNINYQWTTIDGNIVLNANTNNPLVNAAGTYTLTVTNTNNGCESTDEAMVVVDTIKPIADAGLDAFINCYNNVAVLDGSASSSGTTITYQWTPTVMSGGTTNAPTVNAAGNYTLTVTNTSNECFASDEVNVDADLEEPGALAGVTDTLCAGTSLSLSGTTIAGDQINWTTTDGSIVSGASTLTPEINSGGTYTLTTTNSVNGCESTSNVYIHEIVVSTLLNANPTSGLAPLTVDFSNTGMADSSYWNFGNGQTMGDTSTISTASIIYNEQGNYVVTLTSISGQCSQSQQVTIEVLGTSFLIVPNVFTPNGDDQNDVFEFMYQNISAFNCTIFNRWGKKVAEITAPDKSWDGSINGGGDASVGTYFYLIKAKGNDEVDYDLKGTVSLMR